VFLLALSLVPLSVCFYWLPYALRGKGKYAYYEFGGYIEFHYIMPGIGVLAALLYVGLFFALGRRILVPYFIVSALMLVSYAINGFADGIPDFGE